MTFGTALVICAALLCVTYIVTIIIAVLFKKQQDKTAQAAVQRISDSLQKFNDEDV